MKHVGKGEKTCVRGPARVRFQFDKGRSITGLNRGIRAVGIRMDR